MTCHICRDENARAAIDAALKNKRTFTAIAEASGFSRSSIWRHKENCIPRDNMLRFRNDPRNRNFFKGRTGGRIMKDGTLDPPWADFITIVTGPGSPAPKLPDTLPKNIVVVELHVKFVRAPIGNPKALLMDAPVSTGQTPTPDSTPMKMPEEINPPDPRSY